MLGVASGDITEFFMGEFLMDARTRVVLGRLAHRMKIAARSVEEIDACEELLRALSEISQDVDKVISPRQDDGDVISPCPICEARRGKVREATRRWRGRASGSKS